MGVGEGRPCTPPHGGLNPPCSRCGEQRFLGCSRHSLPANRQGLWPCGYQHQVTISVVAQMSKPWALIKLIPAPCFWGKGHHGEHPRAPSSEECRLFGAAWPPGRP